MSRRAWILIAVPVLLVLALVLGPLAYAALQDDAAPAPTVEAQPGDAELSADTDGVWTVTDGSTAGYRVDEVLNGADVTVAGTTDRVTGTVEVAAGELAAAQVTVDVASITTDSGRRDAYFRDRIMDVGTHPTATFAVREPADLPELSGEPVTVPVAGELTLAGETRPVQVELSVVRTPDGVDVSGAIPTTFTDFGIEPPDLGFVRVADSGAVEFLLRLVP
jgi:polyisoprenoid-binding protein YceI